MSHDVPDSRPPFVRSEHGFVLTLGGEERDLLVRLLNELTQLLVGSADEPVLRRMFPPAYHRANDAEADAEYQRLMREDLVASRLTAINTVTAAINKRAILDEESMLAFLQAINGLRLVLGTMLDVREDEELEEIADDDPMVGEHHLYSFLSYLLDAAVRALGE